MEETTSLVAVVGISNNLYYKSFPGLSVSSGLLPCKRAVLYKQETYRNLLIAGLFFWFIFLLQQCRLLFLLSLEGSNYGMELECWRRMLKQYPRSGSRKCERLGHCSHVRAHELFLLKLPYEPCWKDSPKNQGTADFWEHCFYITRWYLILWVLQVLLPVASISVSAAQH